MSRIEGLIMWALIVGGALLIHLAHVENHQLLEMAGDLADSEANLTAIAEQQAIVIAGLKADILCLQEQADIVTAATRSSWRQASLLVRNGAFEGCSEEDNGGFAWNSQTMFETSH